MKHVIPPLVTLLALGASAITTTLEYEDLREQRTLEAVRNATNELDRALSAKIEAAKPFDYETVKSNAAEAVKVETDPTVPAWAKAANPPAVTETDPTVPAWAKAANPPAVTETDPTVPAWAKSPTPPAPGNYATVSNKAMSAVQVETDPTVPAWAKVANPPAPGNYNTVSNRAMSAVQQGTIATVATSGSYNDLLNKPTIPEAVTDLHIKEVAEENRTDHPYLEVRDSGIYVVIPE